jgi:hypothetical protein
MSNRSSRIALAAAACVLTATLAAAQPMRGDKPPRPPRKALDVTRWSYSIVQGGEEKGTESGVKTEYSDNTISFDVALDITPAEDTGMKETVDLTLQADSYFPLRLSMVKKIRVSDSNTELDTDIEMFANLAVIKTTTPGSSGTRRVVVPTGGAFVETGMVYSYYQLLFWYDRGLGGWQNFDALDVASGKVESTGLFLSGQDTVTVSGTEYPVDVFKLRRQKFEVTLYVDNQGRMVRVEQNLMTFDLTDWSHEVVGAE